ncbi:NAD(P)-dependent dehydrogenase (short-subunit alcohol dehydrogenase family) [Catenuloplanes nepalensis]|uniref:NAD(P)-dependent dehydrogenase (Short-subunit alcohol dehydrogenase family) n=1 Tax=Catenuloplanes nepalensis TaxID=587533 RepID=A0ABT9MNN7_9ACTN|nr:SDR family NAD(P)-dependent oxidoreductase [Catenuloplanes nepalensis]MDP9793029.1 NAD(P)-dependent dehydrogenase (short-subunit alcohol dehydrogenase family) [Catenuloplanes nepalensis]
MPTIAIIGAGPGLSQSIAKRFGREGFSVGLVSRTQTKLDALAQELGSHGVEAAGFAADVTDPAALAAAIARITERFGEIDVLSFSPSAPADAALAPVAVTELTLEAVRPQLDFYLGGGLTAAQQVLPAMTGRGSGTILFSTGGTSANPGMMPAFGNIAVGAGALRNYALSLHAAVAEQGVYVAHVPLSVWIGHGGPETQPDTIAEHYWTIHTKREGAEHPYVAMP